MIKLKRVLAFASVLLIGSLHLGGAPVYGEEYTREDKQSVDDYGISLLDDGDSSPSKSYVSGSETGSAYAGSMPFTYEYGVNEYIGYISVSTSDTSDIDIDGIATDSWGIDHTMSTYAAQTTYASTSAKCPTFNQISVVDYDIRVDGPEAGTNVSGSKQFAPISY